MGEVVAVFVTSGLVVLVFYGMLWGLSRSLRRRNEVSVRHTTRPPLRWLASPEVCGRLHRRLRDALVVLRVAIPEPRGRRRRELSPLAALAAELEMHAVALDCDLRVVARLRGQTRTAERQAVTARIAAVERNAHRLAAEARGRNREGAEATDEALRRISEYLDARDAAWEDLSRIERDAGLRATA